MDLSAYERLQATLMVPPPAGPVIDGVRRQWDTALASIIDAHITVVRRVRDPGRLIDHLGATAPPGPCRLGVGEVRMVEPPEAGGVFLEVADRAGDLSALRSHLAPIIAAPDFSVPHITLLHPRTTTLEQRRAASEQLGGWRPALDFTVERLSLLGQRASGWTEVISFALGSGP